MSPGPALPVHPDAPYRPLPETLLPRFYTATPPAFGSAPSPAAATPPRDEPRPQPPPLYLPGLSQASVVLLCGGGTALGQGQRSPASREGMLGKRRIEEEEGRVVKRDRQAPTMVELCHKVSSRCTYIHTHTHTHTGWLHNELSGAVATCI